MTDLFPPQKVMYDPISEFQWLHTQDRQSCIHMTTIRAFCNRLSLQSVVMFLCHVTAIYDSGLLPAKEYINSLNNCHIQ